ncbi:uncharacterized protein V1510DRAFT_392193 [Dipodascopsis tothii]|uniref:uncharacterized protein n=1 Tax=Dipodascopsis tothii TaxID=44089 RepID=UPI0034CF8C35
MPTLFKHLYEDDIKEFQGLLAAGGPAAPQASPGAPLAPRRHPAAPAAHRDINRTDDLGRTVLHLAATLNRPAFAAALIAAPGVDLVAADRESGWTALHRALYAGNVGISQALIRASQDTIRAKDHEGNSPFDVLNATLDETNPEPLDRDVGGSALFTFGSNANHTLGFHDADDRAKPERVVVQRPGDGGEPAPARFRELRIRDVQMSKLHTVVLSTDPSNNLYVCGFGNGGRLGLATKDTQFTLKHVPGFGGSAVVHVALGQDHTVAVTRAGEVYTWGSNRHGQLGYSVEPKKPSDEPIQWTPRKVTGAIRKEHVRGAAASRVHSAVFTASDLYMWGTNAGQLGIAAAAGDRVELSPVKVSTLPGPVAMLAALDHATVCLLETHDVIVYTNGGSFKVAFPLERFADQFDVFRPRASYTKNTVTKVVAHGATVCALSSLGDVFSFQLDPANKARPNVLAKAVKPHTVWSLKRKHLAVRDVDVDRDGNVVVCTMAGSLWRKVKRATAKDSHGKRSEFKFQRVAHLTRVVAVRSNTAGAFAAIRSDSAPPPVDVAPPALPAELARLLPFVGAAEADDGALSSVGSDDSDGDQPALPASFAATRELLQRPDLAEALRDQVDALQDQADALRDRAGAGGSADLFVASHERPDVLLPAHRIVVGARSRVLRELLLGGAVPDALAAHVAYAERGGKGYLTLLSTGLVATVLLVYFCYTDVLVPAWDGYASRQLVPRYMHAAKDDVIRLAALLHIKHLSAAAYFAHRGANQLPADLAAAASDPRTEAWADLVIELEDAAVCGHSCVLAVRSPFFATLTASRWTNAGAAAAPHGPGPAAPGVRRVDMRHLRLARFQLVLDYVYEDRDESTLFAGVHAESLPEFLAVVLDVLAIANELLMDRLMDICQAVLVRYVNVRNAAELLVEADTFAADRLKASLLAYIAVNLECMLEDHLLEDVGPELLAELEKEVVAKQVARLPVSKSGRLLRELEERHATLADARRREKESLILQLEAAPCGAGPAPLPPTPLDAAKQRRRRRYSREAAPAQTSPVLRPSASHSDFIFDMDDEPAPPAQDWVRVKGKAKAHAGRSSPSNAPAEFGSPRAVQSPPSSAPREPGTYFRSRPASVHDRDELGASPRDAARTPTAPRLAAGSWTPAGAKMSPIDFKTADRDRRPSVGSSPSGIALGLKKDRRGSAAGPAAGPAAAAAGSADGLKEPQFYVLPQDESALTKMSQKERKKIRQAEQMAAANPAPAKAAGSPWHKPIPEAPQKTVKDRYLIGPATSPQHFVVSSPQLLPNGPQNSYATILSQHMDARAPRPPAQENSPWKAKPTAARSELFGKQSMPGPARAASALSVMLAEPRDDSAIVVQFSLADIMKEQTQQQQEILTEQTTKAKSIKEIQEEEEFEKWWAEESARTQLQMRGPEPEAGQSAREPRRKGRGTGDSPGSRRGRGRARKAGAAAPPRVDSPRVPVNN